MSLSALSPVLSADAMRQADVFTIDRLGIGGFTLMETAGRAVADEVARTAPAGSRALVLCGKGNNGGDGFVAARYLLDRGFAVRIVTTAQRAEYEGDAAAHLNVLSSLLDKADHLSCDLQFGDAEAVDFRHGEVVVDALLGTGISSEVREPIASLIDRLNDFAECAVVSVDIPSGIEASTGRVLGRAVRASATVTMGAFKAGLLLGEGPDYTGEVQVADIGIPRFVLDRQAEDKGSGYLCSRVWVCDRLPERSRSDHKYSTGPTLVVGGSPDFPGAPVLAARAAARAGSGYVVACGPESIRDHLFEKLTEVPVAAWDAGLPPEEAARTLRDALDNRWDKARSMLIGPGIGRSDWAHGFVRSMLDLFEGPAVVDADALYLLRDDGDWVRDRSEGRWIFTPHLGEFQRLVQSDGGIHDRLGAASEFAADWNVTLLLKGMPSIVAGPGRPPIINPTGNPAAGTAGSGDVLAGIVSGLAAQGLEPLHAAAAGVYIAGAVADHFVRKAAARSMMAGDIVEQLPDTLRTLCEAS